MRVQPSGNPVEPPVVLARRADQVGECPRVRTAEPPYVARDDGQLTSRDRGVGTRPGLPGGRGVGRARGGGLLRRLVPEPVRATTAASTDVRCCSTRAFDSDPETMCPAPSPSSARRTCSASPYRLCHLQVRVRGRPGDLARVAARARGPRRGAGATRPPMLPVAPVRRDGGHGPTHAQRRCSTISSTGRPKQLTAQQERVTGQRTSDGSKGGPRGRFPRRTGAPLRQVSRLA